jgi:hypothetical protein
MLLLSAAASSLHLVAAPHHTHQLLGASKGLLALHLFLSRAITRLIALTLLLIPAPTQLPLPQCALVASILIMPGALRIGDTISLQPADLGWATIARLAFLWAPQWGPQP